MDSVTIRPVRGEERQQTVLRLGGYAFNPSPPLPDKDGDWPGFLAATEAHPNRVVFEGEQALAMAHSAPMTQQVRGRLFPMGGVWGVATMPAARRGGYAREALRQLLADVREAGVPLTCLYAFKELFYERLGYVNFPQPRQVTFSPKALLPLVEQDLGRPGGARGDRGRLRPVPDLPDEHPGPDARHGAGRGRSAAPA